MKRISILGCGWLGLPLAKKLISHHYLVKGSTTTVEKLEILLNEGISPYIILIDDEIEGNLSHFLNSDICIINIPFRQQKNFYKSYQRLVQEIAKSDIQKVIFISSTAVYADVNTEIIDANYFEINPAKEKLVQLENLFKENDGFDTTILRFAGLIGNERNPGNFFKNVTSVPNALAPVNLIHIEDCVDIILQLISKNIWNVSLHAAADSHPSKMSYYSRAAIKLGKKPATFIEELNSFKIINSQELKKMLNYKFKHPDLIENLETFKN